MALGRLWAGRAFGTNVGNLFVRFDGPDDGLQGTLHLNEPGVAVVVYGLRGSFDGQHLKITGEPRTEVDGLIVGQLSAIAELSPRGELRGEWSTTIGTAGTFVLFPHDQPQQGDTRSQTPDQLHTARHHFGAIEVDRSQILAIADEIQSEFKNAQVVVTVVTSTEQSRFLPDFKLMTFGSQRATIVKLFVQQPDGGGVNRIAVVEFGQQVNLAMTQGSDEAWVLGMLEKLKRMIKPLGRAYATNFKKFGFGINQALLAGAIVFLPSLTGLLDRAYLFGGVLTLTFVVQWLHVRYLPFAAIYLGEKPTGWFARLYPGLVSWIIAVAAGVVATLLAAYLKGWLSIPGD